MKTLAYNDRVTLGYEHITLYGSSNVINGARYFTKVYLVQGTARYELGEWDGKVEEDDIKWRFKEIYEQEQQKQYGSQRQVLRKTKKTGPGYFARPSQRAYREEKTAHAAIQRSNNQ